MSRFMNLGLVLAMVVPSVASAVPDGYESAVCEGGGGYEICTLLYPETGTVWECDLTRPGVGAAGGTLWAVLDDSDPITLCGDDDYCAWGLDETGEKFFCSVMASENIVQVLIIGTEYSDTITLFWDESGHEFNLDYSDESEEDHIDGKVLANGGNDFIYGSRTTASEYKDFLSGGVGEDTIDGNAGSDTLMGGNDADTLNGGDGVDFIHGGTGTDTIWGGAGGDFIWGDEYTDYIAGGDGEDNIRGGTGVDYICGDGDSDIIRGENDGDYLYAGSTVETIEGGGGEDHCQEGYSSTCEYADLTGRPGSCPEEE